MEIDHGGFDVGVAEEALDGLEVVACQKEMTGKGVPEGVRGNPLPLLDGIFLFGQFGQKRAKSGWCRGGVAKFLAEV